MDDDELLEILIRAWALHCATAGVNWPTKDALYRARKFEKYIRGEQEN